MIIYSQDALEEIKDFNPTAKLFYAVVAYVFLLTASSISGSDAVKMVANLSAIAIFGFLLFEFFLLQERRYFVGGLRTSLVIYYIGMFGSALFSLQFDDAVDFLKISLFPMFALFGCVFECHRTSWLWRKKSIKCAYALLIALPLAAFVFQMVLWGASLDHGGEIGIFVNRNNAALYAVTLLSLYILLSGRPISSAIPFLLVGVMFGTLGVLVAVLLGLFVAIGNWRTARVLLVGVLVAGGLLFMIPDTPIVARMQPVFDSIGLLYRGQIDLRTVTFGDMVGLLHTSDLSFLFRLKHWVELWDLYAKGEMYQWLFGLGVGSSVRLSEIGLVPHNDYLRFLVECGAVAFIGFVSLMVALVRAIGRRWELVPTLVVVIYFGSENLINNFVAMMIMFFCAGALATRIQLQKLDVGARSDAVSLQAIQ